LFVSDLFRFIVILYNFIAPVTIPWCLVVHVRLPPGLILFVKTASRQIEVWFKCSYELYLKGASSNQTSLQNWLIYWKVRFLYVFNLFVIFVIDWTQRSVFFFCSFVSKINHAGAKCACRRKISRPVR
jgi:hypothetical protein